MIGIEDKFTLAVGTEIVLLDDGVVTRIDSFEKRGGVTFIVVYNNDNKILLDPMLREKAWDFAI